MKLNSYLKIFFQLTAGITVGICGFLLPFLHPTIFDNILVLQPGSIALGYWQKVDVTANYYFFNWTNPENFYNASVKPRFNQMGPYTFRQQEEKVNLTWNSNNTVTFATRQFWFYEDRRKNNGLQDKVVTMNPIPLAVSYIVRNWNYYYRKYFFMGLSIFGSNLYMTQTVGSLLFDGYSEPLIKLGANLPFLSQYNLPSWDRMGYLYKRNGTTEFNGVLNMGTGKTSHMGEIYYWNYQTKSPYYDNVCGNIRGSAQQLFSRNLKKTFLPYLIIEIGRSLKLDFEKEETFNNILGYKYVITEKLLDNGTIYPENRCSCNGECVPSGTFNGTSCTYNLPTFFSLPHFYKADRYYTSLVDGLKPDANKHNLFIIVEPTTGIPIKMHITLQLNLLVQPVPDVAMFKKAPRYFHPVLWIEYTYEMQGLLAFLVKLVLLLHVILKLIGACMMLFSIFMIAVIVPKGVIHLRQKHNKLELFEEQDILLNLHFQEAT